jgi:DNA-binding NtrC family response regulator
VFLDEVGELPLNLQVKLLRFLEAKEIRRVGDSVPIKTDVRVLCATHRDLRAMIREGTFREDLYFRINMFEVRLPSLRERREDIADLAYHLLARAARRPVDQVVGLLSPEVLRALEGHDWPGNVRELANAMEHAWILSGGKRIGPEHLPHLVRRTAPIAAPVAMPVTATSAHSASPSALPSERRTLEDVEMEHLLRTLERLGGNKTLAAAELGISLKTLYNKLNKLADKRAAG